jgi:hypothetical protein
VELIVSTNPEYSTRSFFPICAATNFQTLIKNRRTDPTNKKNPGKNAYSQKYY